MTVRLIMGAIALLLAAMPANAETIIGPAKAIDGDTLEISGQRIRLFGIDAPERSQTCARNAQERAGVGETGFPVSECGNLASAAQRALVALQTVSCKQVDRDRYGRIVATCSTPDTPDIGAAMVRSGWAVPYLRYGGARYLDDENKAKAEKLGVHSGYFTMPADYRKGVR